MTTHHHIGEDLLWDYHRGACPPGLELTVATHMELCPQCREDAAVLDTMGGVLLDGIEGIAVSETALDLALARIERPQPAVQPLKRKPPAFLAGYTLPETLDAAVIRDRYWAAPGVWMAPIDIDSGSKTAKTYLMRVKGGMAMPEHTHRGMEATLVLKGRFKDKFGEYRPGDIAFCDQKDCHSPAIAADEDCLCLVWQDAPILPKTLLGKLLQPFARI